MIVWRLPYRMQVPFGLAIAVVITAILVTIVSARLFAASARSETLATVDRAMVLLAAQARPLLASDDVWRAFTLLRSAESLLPGFDAGHARAAVLDARGSVFAGSQPTALPTGAPMLGELSRGIRLPARDDVTRRSLLETGSGDLIWLDAIRSEDGELVGYGYIEVDAPVFEPAWAALAMPVAIAALLAAALLVPAGWLAGKRMARPVAKLADCVSQIGRMDADRLAAQLPRATDPELARIIQSVAQLLGEMRDRKVADLRALSAERMAAVGRLTAAVAHEINNPIGGLMNAVGTLKLHGDSVETRARTVNLIERGLLQIRTTVAALLPQARVEERALELHDIEDVRMLVQSAASRLRVSVDLEANVTSALRVPSSVMRQVMLNLLLNAINAAGESGRVHALLDGDPERVAFRVCNSGERLTANRLEAGIDAESGNDPRGFGLWVCRQVATQYGGHFVLTGTCEDATCLSFSIPNRERHDVTAAD